jgi:parallel beta-helix repeat protein
LLQPDGTAPALVWRIEAQANNNLPINEFILIDAARGHIVLNFNQVDTAWNEAETGKVENEDVPQTATPTPTPIVPTSTPEAPQTPTSDGSIPQTDIQPTATLPAEKTDTDQPDKTDPQPQLGVTYYVDIATGNNSNSCTAPASPCKDIQETINKAGTGDIIRIASGVYVFSTNPSPNVVIINGKDLTLSGGWNSTFTTQNGVSTIDGQNTNNGYLHISGTVTIENFIIQNSTSADSGAIYIVGGTLTLKRSTLKNNYASNRGGGIFMAGAGTLTVENSTLSGNTALVSGAGMYLCQWNRVLSLRLRTLRSPITHPQAAATVAAGSPKPTVLRSP